MGNPVVETIYGWLMLPYQPQQSHPEFHEKQHIIDDQQQQLENFTLDETNNFQRKQSLQHKYPASFMTRRNSVPTLSLQSASYTNHFSPFPSSSPSFPSSSPVSAASSPYQHPKQLHEQKLDKFADDLKLPNRLKTTRRHASISHTDGPSPFFRSIAQDQSTSEFISTISSPDEYKSSLLYVFDIPVTLSLADFYDFTAPCAELMSHLLIVSTEGLSARENTYVVVIKFLSPEAAAEFAVNYDRKPYNSFEPYLCKVAPVDDVVFADSKFIFPYDKPRDSTDSTYISPTSAEGKKDELTTLKWRKANQQAKSNPNVHSTYDDEKKDESKSDDEERKDEAKSDIQDDFKTTTAEVNAALDTHPLLLSSDSTLDCVSCPVW